MRNAERTARRRVERFTNALAAVMATEAGRIVLGELVRRAGVYQSTFNTHGGVQSFNIGRQDYGHELMADLIRTSEDDWQRLEREQWLWSKAQEREVAAQHTARASDTAGEDA